MAIKPSSVFTFVLSIVSIFSFNGAAKIFPAHAQAEVRLKIVATTSVIAEIASQVGGNAVEVATLIPPASCPGHFDIKPEDMKLLADAQVFMLHDWQGRQFSDVLIRASRNKALTKAVLSVPGNWMTPPVQAAATDQIATLLMEADPAQADAYRMAADRRKAEVQRVGAALIKRLADANVGRTAVLANDMQADFIRWTGFQVVGVFGRGEDMSPRDVEDAIRLGQARTVSLVADNLQSGKQAGISIAKEIGAVQVTLSNFPGGFADTETWAKAFEKNIDLLLASIGK